MMIFQELKLLNSLLIIINVSKLLNVKNHNIKINRLIILKLTAGNFWMFKKDNAKNKLELFNGDLVEMQIKYGTLKKYELFEKFVLE